MILCGAKIAVELVDIVKAREKKLTLNNDSNVMKQTSTFVALVGKVD